MKTIARMTATVLFLVVAIALTSSQVMAFDAGKIGAELTKEPANMTNALDQAASVKDGYDINLASPEMLAQIPGIGPQIADGIVKYRELKGKYTSVKELLNVDGMTPALLEKITPYLKGLQ